MLPKWKRLLQTFLFLQFFSNSATNPSETEGQCQLPKTLEEHCLCINNDFIQCSGKQFKSDVKNHSENSPKKFIFETFIMNFRKSQEILSHNT